jgi:hypothetical protein
MSMVKIHWFQDVNKLTIVSFLMAVCIRHKSSYCIFSSTPQCHQQTFVFEYKNVRIRVFHLMENSKVNHL